MTLKEKITLARKNWKQIAEGAFNLFIYANEAVKEEGAKRKAICESNVCGYYDAEGKPENAVIPGQPSCSICKCNIAAKTMAMSVECALGQIDKEPLWKAVMDEDQDNEYKQKEWEAQFKKNK